MAESQCANIAFDVTGNTDEILDAVSNKEIQSLKIVE